MASENAPAARGGQFLDDHQSLAALIDEMPRQERDLYKSFGALTLEASFPNRKMVVYTIKDGQPTNLETLHFGDIELARIGGPLVHLQDSKGSFSIGMTPTRYRDRDLFLHIPQNFTFKWKGKQTNSGKIQFVPHYAVLVKTRSKEIHQVEGHTYCVTFNRFRERFPHVPVWY